MPKPKMGRPKTLAERTAAATLTATVTGSLPIRDHITRESVEQGGTVRLDPTTTLIDALVETGAIEVVPGKAKSGDKA